MDRRPYPSDLTDAEWVLLASLIPSPKSGGRPPTHARRELIDAMCYVLRTACAWRLHPHDFPPWQTVYPYFRRWRWGGWNWHAAQRFLMFGILGLNASLSCGYGPVASRSVSSSLSAACYE